MIVAAKLGSHGLNGPARAPSDLHRHIGDQRGFRRWNAGEKDQREARQPLGYLEEPRSGGVHEKEAQRSSLALIRPYFVAPQSDTSIQYPLFEAPRLDE